MGTGSHAHPCLSQCPAETVQLLLLAGGEQTVQERARWLLLLPPCPGRAAASPPFCPKAACLNTMQKQELPDVIKAV